jgi:hypothetical protein
VKNLFTVFAKAGTDNNQGEIAMAAYEMNGTVKMIMDEMTFPSGFSKREFVITTEADRFPQEVKFECLKDKASLLNNVKEGQKIKVTFDINGREYNGKYFVSLVAWKIADAGAGAPAANDEPPFDENDAFIDDPEIQF